MSFLLRPISFLFLLLSILNTFVSPTQHLCHPDTRDALLEFKTEFGIQKLDLVDLHVERILPNLSSYPKLDSYPKTKSWVNKSDCCSWDGVTCDVRSGQVVGLDLSDSCLHGRLESNSSLFKLQHLRDLNLAYNNFTDSPIPAEFDKLEGLERLNLSKSFFSGQIPTKLLHLIKLVSLDLSSFSLHDALYPYFKYHQNHLSVDETFLPILTQNLRNLRDLDMSYSNLSSQIPTEFSTMWSLRSLGFEGCSLFGEFPTSVILIPNLQSLVLNSNTNLSGNLPVFRKDNSLQILSLSKTSFSGIIPDSISNLKHFISFDLSSSNFSGKIPFSLGNLTHLSSLELSGNNFSGEIPSSIGNLKKLIDFDVAGNSLSGNFPSTLLNLTQLRTLDLMMNEFTGALPPNISQLSKLEVFVGDGNFFTGAIPSSMFKISSLTFINLLDNQLSDLAGIENVSLLTNLEVFFLGDNKFSMASPVDLNVFSPLKHLQILDLSGIPLSTENITYDSDFPSHLESLYLSSCNITEFPKFLRNQRDLQNLNLSNNKFSMVSPVDLNIFSPLKQLQSLHLSGIPLSTENITYDSDFSSHLEHLFLSGCNITKFPKFLRNQRNLQTLYLSDNKIKGQVPDWLWKLPELSRVNLSNNSLAGFLGSLEAFSRSKIYLLDLASNAFQGPLLIPPGHIDYYYASKNNFSGEIPRSICRLTSPLILDLSNNNLHGQIPRCLKTQMSSLVDLNLRNNSLNGSLSDIFMHAKELKSLDVSHNRFEGNLPPSLTGCSSLKVLNVESNGMSGMFPFHLNSLQKLQVLVLRSNKFHGMLHHSDGVWFGFPQLKILDVSHNDFDGTLPSDYFLNWTAISSKSDSNAELEYLVSGYNGYYIPLVLMSKGISMEMERILTIYTAIDFSGNRLHGHIPDSIGLLKELRILNLSRNAFTGHIPSSLENLTKLESFDLSQNEISGEIPPELGTLSSFQWINVSHNQLVGSIPQGTQFQRQNCSSYEGNPGLNGPSLKNVCGDNHSPPPPEPEPLETEEEEEEDDGWINWMAAGIGFAPGIVFGLTIGYIAALHKHMWFMKTFG